MECPVDHTKLVMSERLGVEIDYCPECRGVWLDRGELDKIIDRSGSASDGFGEHIGHHDAQNAKKKNPGSFIGDLFGGE
jgi:uncharacterized protein